VFEVGLSELMMVGLVALVVIGPEKLPAVARYAGFWLGKSRRTIASVKAEMQRELEVEELRRQLAAAELQNALDDGRAAAMEIDAALEALAEPTSGKDSATPSL
jgi:sec-independent protein translocase protein TatB